MASNEMSKELNQKLSPLNSVLMFLISRVPYGVGARVLAWFFGIDIIRRILYRQRWPYLRKVLTLCPPGTEEEDVFIRHLSCNLLMPWRVVALSRLNSTELDKWVSFKNEDILLDEYNKDTGVVLVNSHIGAGRIIALMLLRRGYKITTMDPEPYLLKMGAKDADKIPVISLRGGDKFWLKEVFKAKKVLNSGEMLTLVADGRVGKGGVEHSFHDIKIPFYVSFAQLALQTNSSVVPVFANIDSKGKVVIEFLPSLDSGNENATNDERVSHLLDQYVASLEQEWRDNPGNILATHVRLYNQEKAEQSSTMSTVGNPG